MTENLNSVENNSNLFVINLFGGPGSGKSTTAAGLFHLMKLANENVELVTEFAKDMVYQKRDSVFSEQDYIFAKQHHRQRRLVQYGVRSCVTDSPLILGLLYTPDDYYPSFRSLVAEAYNSFTNINFFIVRVKEYNPSGRNQDEAGARDLDRKTLELLFDQKLPFFLVHGDKDAPTKIMDALHSKADAELEGIFAIDPSEISKEEFLSAFEEGMIEESEQFQSGFYEVDHSEVVKPVGLIPFSFSNIKEQLENIFESFFFEPNNDFTRNHIRAVAEGLLEYYKNRNELYDYAVICDDTNNTPATLEMGQLNIDLCIKPYIHSTFFHVPVKITPSSTDF